MNPYNFSLLCFGFCSLLLGVLVWLKREDEIGKKYLILSCFYAGWSIFLSISLSQNASYELALLTVKLSNGIATFIPVIWYQFVMIFIGEKGRHKLFIRIIYGASFFVASFALTPWFVPGVGPAVGFKYYLQPGPLHYVFSFLFFTVVPMSFIQLFKKIKQSRGDERRQLSGLFWVAFAGYFGGSLTFLPIYGIPLPQYGIFLLPLYPFGLAYVMMKQKLFDVEELAQAAHRDKLTAIGVLAASINHEVKNPLFIIKGLAESWLERQKDGIFKDAKQTIESGQDTMKRSMEQADRAMDIIKRLSLFAKAGIDSEIKFEQVNVAQVIEDVLPLVRYELAAHGIALSREIPPNLPEVRADRRYLEEILFNLIVNACQAVKEGGKSGEIKLTAKTGARDHGPCNESFLKSRGTWLEERGSVVITIQDTGPGIPADKLKDVFRPFYTTKAEGTGLGLYITQQLVEKIRGRIDVQSEVGVGTTFTVLLPVGGQFL